MENVINVIVLDGLVQDCVNFVLQKKEALNNMPDCCDDFTQCIERKLIMRDKYDNLYLGGVIIMGTCPFCSHVYRAKEAPYKSKEGGFEQHAYYYPRPKRYGMDKTPLR